MEKLEGIACAKCQLKPSEKACEVKGGKAPSFCPTKHKDFIIKINESYKEPNVREFAQKATIIDAECYINRDAIPSILHPAKPRLQEICEFSKKMGYKRLGLAFCGGLYAEAAILSKVLEFNGFEIASVSCKAGCTPKEEIGLTDSEKVRIGQFEAMCNPILQAEILNEGKTDFNIIMGLCVGHDSLFFKYAKAPTTVFAVKDRLLGHNPLAAIYTSGVYYQRFLKLPIS